MMDHLFKPFYQSSFNRTNGFIPSMPIVQSLYPGDFFQINNGEMTVLGNIFRSQLTDPANVMLEYGIQQNAANWYFSQGVSRPYSSRKEDSDGVQYKKLHIHFDRSGSFLFRANNVESIKISNWSQIKHELIIKMTASIYSFREVYIVTESAIPSDWTLAISGSEHGELELSDTSESNSIDFFGSEYAKTIQARDIEYYNREKKRKPTFFKGKKLVAQPERLDIFMSDLINQRRTHEDWAHTYFDYDFGTKTEALNNPIRHSPSAVVDLLHSNELNPNTALSLFKFADINLDDIEKLFTQ